MTPSAEDLLAVLDQMIQQQQRKVYILAVERVPGITLEESRNAHDYAALRQDWAFNFEDGVLSGLISARMALLAELHPPTTNWDL
jgi:hypothetical protein